MIERISQFIQNQGISVRSFEQSISASDGMIRRAINNKTDIQSKWLSVIADNYPHHSPTHTHQLYNRRKSNNNKSLQVHHCIQRPFQP